MSGKLVFFAVAGIAVVAAVIGLISSDVVYHKTSKENDSEDDPLSTTSKSVASVCSSTDFKEACVNSLNSLVNNQSATPKDFIQAAIDYTIQEVKTALDKSGTIGKAVANEPRQKMAVDDCQDLMQFAIDELQASFSAVGDSSVHTISDKEAELRNWLSAVVSYHEACLDGCDDHPELKNSMSNGLLNTTQLTSNALAIVSTLADILKSFNIQVNTSTAASRRLLDATDEVGKDGYPAWLSAADRKLLASNNQQIVPNAVVAKDGSGQYKTVAAAIARKSIITGRKSNTQGVSTMQTASFATVGTGFIAKAMGFTNTAGPEGHQAVALRSQSDMSAFYNCRIDGYQDSLYIQTHRQFYRNCVISGTVDFIFGDAAAVIQNSLIIVRKPMPNQQNTVTAHGKSNRFETTGLVIQNCRIVPEQKLFAERLDFQLSWEGRGRNTP